MKHPISSLCVLPHLPIREAIACIDRGEKRIALVVDKDGKFLDTITDGDVRRAILAGIQLESPIINLMEHKNLSHLPKPVTTLLHTTRLELLDLMREHHVLQIPLLDKEGRVKDLVALEDLELDSELPLQAIIMAGGLGNRLRPLTEEIPKPMLHIGDRPLLQRLVEQLRDAGVKRLNLTTHYRGEVIKNHFGDGKNFGVEIDYLDEEHPLGTAGVLRRMPQLQGPLLVINGDILTDVNFEAMLRFHREHQADMTVGVRTYDFHIPYGVVNTNGVNIQDISEKPLQKYFINAGIYLVDPEVCAHIPEVERYDMPDLINRLITLKKQVISFPIREYWLDIGKLEDYQQAIEDIEGGKI